MKHEPSVWLYYDETWNEVSDQVRERDPITIRWGKQDETSAPVPSQLNLTLDNRAQLWDPDDPMSTVYGSIGRNTPIQVGYDEAIENWEDTSYAFTWGTNGDANWARSTTQKHGGSWSLKSGAVSVAGRSYFTITGLSTLHRNTVEFWYWADISSSCYLAAYNDDGLVWYSTGSSSGWRKAAVEVGPGDHVTFSYQRNGTAGTNAIYLDDVRVLNARFTGEVSKWVPETSDDFEPGTGRGDAWTKIVAGGLLRRLNQNTEAIHSPIYRMVQYGGVTPAAYWPMEDAAGSAQAVEWSGGEPLTPVTVVRYTTGDGVPIPPGGAPEFARGAGITGSESLPSFRDGGTLSAVIPAVDFNGYAVDWVMQHAPGSGTSVDVLRWTESGTYVQFTVNAASSGVTVFHANAADAALSGFTGSAASTLNPFDGAPHHYRYQVRQSGGSYSATLYIDGVTRAVADNFTPGMAGTVGRPTYVEWNPGESNDGSMPAAAGHLIVWPSGQLGDQPAVFAATAGHLTEQAHNRLDRLGSEEGFEVVFDNVSKATAPMGPQPAAKWSDLVAEIERTEDGLIYDMRGAVALLFRPKRAMYLREPADLVVSYGTGVQTLKPITDDQSTVNDATAKNSDGAQARSIVATGPLSVNDVGRYPATVDVSVASDRRSLQHIADWASRKGTVPGKRFPSVVIDWDANPALAAAAQDLHPGDRMVIEGFGYDEVNLRVLGGVETIATHRRTLSFNCGPGRQWLPGKYDGTARRADSRNTTLKTGVNASATSLTFRFPDLRGQWSQAAEPYDVVIAGERITVTSMGAPSLVSGAYDQVATVTRHVNGVSKSLGAAEPIHIFEPARWALR